LRDLTTVDDPGFNKKEEYNFLDRFFLKFIRDERDLPFVHLCILMTLTIIPFAVLLFSQLLSGSTFWIASLVYLVLLLYFIGPYTLMLHNTSHRPFFKRKHNIAKYYIPWVLGPFVGQSPET